MKATRLTRGFTLVELLVVIIVIAVLAAMAVPKMSSRYYRSREARLRQDLKTLRSAIDIFHQDTGVWPASVGDLLRKTNPPSCIDDDASPSPSAWPTGVAWNGPYLTNAHACPIGSYEYQVVHVGSRNIAQVNCDSTATGSDGVPYNQW